jgi:hypothetical protein
MVLGVQKADENPVRRKKTGMWCQNEKVFHIRECGGESSTKSRVEPEATGKLEEGPLELTLRPLRKVLLG